MNKPYKESRRIELLRDSVALKIAAGEVIDRPFSVIRELLDNAVDSGASNIDVYIEGGGLDLIRVVDNGNGMSKEDLALCCLPHSTSKIKEIEDLDSLATLGFRGEALSSIAACSRIEITSSTGESGAFKIIVQDSKSSEISESMGNKGTVVNVSRLFHSIPARRKFLKKPSAEGLACKKMFVEKTLPFNNLAFRFFQEGELKLFFPVSSLKERIIAAYPGILHKDLVHEIESEKKSFSLDIIACGPSIFRKDRRYIQIFLNNRKIYDFSLAQAVEYGFSEFLPGGSYPVAFVFITIDPALIDFNIHPAKKEVKIRNTQELHHEIVTTIKSFLTSFTFNFNKSTSPQTKEIDFPSFTAERLNTVQKYNHSMPKRIESSPGVRSNNYSNINVFTKPAAPIKTKPDSAGEEKLDYTPAPDEITYLGQVFDLFLVVSIKNKVYFIDQHAAHEKILFIELLESKGDPQSLLIPLTFTVESATENILRQNMENYKKMGIEIEELREMEWSIRTIPAKCVGSENVIIDFIKNQKGSVKDLETALYADIACKSAIKDGEVLDEVTALELIKKTMLLDNARCPHGRPIWFEISREELFNLVGRT